MLLTRPSKAANRKTNLLEESLKLCLHEMPQLSCAVERHYFNMKFSIEVASLDCITLIAKAQADKRALKIY